jgi:hypothetical protein
MNPILCSRYVLPVLCALLCYFCISLDYAARWILSFGWILVAAVLLGVSRNVISPILFATILIVLINLF